MQSPYGPCYLGKEIKGYNFISVLGQGSFGKVYKTFKNDKNQFFAIKTISFQLINKFNAKRFIDTEIDIMRSHHHQNILGLIEEFDTPTHKCIVMKVYEEGDLSCFLKQVGRFPETDCVHILMQILDGFQELHKLKIIHRDFKLANILIDKGSAVIADFGLAKKGSETTCTFVGTLLTQAPEVTEYRTVYDNRVDIWSIGVCCYQMLFGHSPFGRDINERTLALKNHSGKNLRFAKEIPVSENCKDLLRRMLEIDPNQRIFWLEIYTHPLFREFENIEMEYSVLKIEAPVENKVHQQFMKTGKEGNLPVLVSTNEEIQPLEVLMFKKNNSAKEIILHKKFSKIDRLFLHEQTLLLYTLKAAQCMKKQAKFIKEGALFLGFMLAKREELRMGEIIKLLELKKDVYQIDAFELYEQKGNLEDKVKELKEVYTQDVQGYVSILRNSMMEEKEKRGKWVEFDKVEKFEFVNLPELQKIMRDLWGEIVLDMRCVSFGEDTMQLIFKDLARFYLCLEADNIMVFSNKESEFNWTEFSKKFEKLDCQVYCNKMAK